jgi:hypothetical protein
MFAQKLISNAKSCLARTGRVQAARPRRRALRLESLEQRELFAADVIASPVAYEAIGASDRTVLCNASQSAATCQVDTAANSARPQWQNPSEPLDVNNDGVVSPVDALIVINDLNSNGMRELPSENPQTVDPRYIDVSGDGFVSPVDVLRVVNFVNSAIGMGEPSGSETSTDKPSSPVVDAAESPVVTLGRVSTPERAGFVEVPVRLSSASSSTVTVGYATVNDFGTATAGADYKSSAGTLVFQPGEREKKLRVGIIDDLFTEDDESFLVQLTSADGALLTMAPAGNSELVTILANDPFIGPLPQSYAQAVDAFYAGWGSATA